MFKDMLIYLRKRDGLTQQQLAEKLKCSRGRISMYELGKRNPDFVTLEEIADFFNVNMSTLLGEEEKPATVNDDELQEWIDIIKKLPPEKRAQLKSFLQS